MNFKFLIFLGGAHFMSRLIWTLKLPTSVSWDYKFLLTPWFLNFLQKVLNRWTHRSSSYLLNNAKVKLVKIPARIYKGWLRFHPFRKTASSWWLLSKGLPFFFEVGVATGRLPMPPLMMTAKIIWGSTF